MTAVLIGADDLAAEGLQPAAPVKARGPRTAVYCRISEDRTGAGLGVERQELEARELADRLGFTVIRVTADNDMSGYKRKRPRPGYDAIVDMIGRGEVDVLMAWHMDRLTRRVIELAELIQLCQDHGVAIQTVFAGAFDLNNPSAVLAAQIQGSVSEYESAVKSARLQAKNRENRRQGKHHGGVRLFGYTKARDAIVEDEAVWVREVVARVLNGESIGSVVRLLNANGVTGTKGGKWNTGNMSNYLRIPSLAGLLAHDGQIVGEASWPAIIDRADWDALQRFLGAPGRSHGKSTARKYLMSGLALCGTCGKPLRFNNRTAANKNGEKKPDSYQCTRPGECPAPVSRRQDKVDAMVVGWVEERLTQLDVSGILADASDQVAMREARHALDAIPARVEALAVQMATGAMSADVFAVATAALEAERDRLALALDTLAIKAAAPERALQGLTGPDPVETFRDLPLDRRRTVVDLLCTVTVVKGARGGRPGFNPELIQITPKTR